jgi:hypothetical protein
MCWTLLILGVCVCVCVCVCRGVVFFVWMVRMWTLEMTAASFSPPMRLALMQMMPFHHGKGLSRFETKERVSFW